MRLRAIWPWVALLPPLYLAGIFTAATFTPVFVQDFTVFWTAARVYDVTPLLIYDVHAMTELQSDFVDPVMGPRPWPYPPTALALVSWTGALDFGLALRIWQTVSVVAFVGVVAWLFREARLYCVIAPFAVFLSAYIFLNGQTSFLVAAGLLTALGLAPRQPVGAGVLFALVALVKPSTVLMVPFAMAAGGHWRVLTWGMATGTSALALSLWLQGPEIWLAWWLAIPDFMEAVRVLKLIPSGMGSPSVQYALGLDGLPSALVKAVILAVSVTLTVAIFLRTRGIAERSIALIGFSLISSPYAMFYDWVGVLPGVALIFYRACLTRPSWVMALVSYLALFPLPGIEGSPALIALIFLFAVSVHTLAGSKPGKNIDVKGSG